ncbi:MAG: hypothetical protein ACPHWZ_13210, partial [Longimicrobiales bacterium]
IVSAALPPLIAFTPHEGGMTLVWLATVLAAFIIWKHRSNIGRLRRGEENRLGRNSDRVEPASIDETSGGVSS